MNNDGFLLVNKVINNFQPPSWLITLYLFLIRIKNNYIITNKIIFILVFTHKLMSVSTIYSVLTQVLWKKNHRHFYSGGIQTHNLCNSRAVSYQLDHRDCQVARGSSKTINKTYYFLGGNFINCQTRIFVLPTK